MSRAGREPAEDVKRRIVAACEAAGLKVKSARMYLRKAQRDRIVLVAASPADWRAQRPMVTILTTVGVCGEWAGEVDVRCSAGEHEPVVKFWEIPVMQGRNTVPMHELPRQLCETMEEREQVVAAMRLGVTGPYTFERSRWQKPGDLLRA
ncbi:MAG: hypothetical protein ACUVXJ_11050 [Phycisphaerae bacterium]